MNYSNLRSGGGLGRLGVMRARQWYRSLSVIGQQGRGIGHVNNVSWQQGRDICHVSDVMTAGPWFRSCQ